MYQMLKDLHAEHKDKADMEILGFPCNQFGGQEPKSDEDIQAFVGKKGVEFPIFAKVDVNGANAIPLYDYLKRSCGGFITNNIKWNFTIFVVGKDGVPAMRFRPFLGSLSGVAAEVERLSKL